MSSPTELPAHPASWKVVRTQRFGPFVTRAVFETETGARVVWESRRHRKGLGLATEAGSTPVHPGHVRFSRAAAHRLNWWIGWLFMIGSAGFALGSAPFYARTVGAEAVGLTYFAGSIFFTSAGALQYLQAATTEHAIGLGEARPRGSLLGAVQPHRIDWWATGVQLLGTVFFNLTTFAALNVALTPQQEFVRVWAPDALGSICFLVASALAWIEVWGASRRAASWRIAALNMIGSVFFGISAVGSYVVPATGEIVSLVATNGGTFLGALCFFVGAYLLLPEDAGR